LLLFLDDKGLEAGHSILKLCFLHLCFLNLLPPNRLETPEFEPNLFNHSLIFSPIFAFLSRVLLFYFLDHFSCQVISKFLPHFGRLHNILLR